ncbi:iron-containing alcohol dehydrogenase [Streptomyces luteoverticillatus]|uniref:2-deoxy-scyllo-inosose synthase n=2 Tax=Streptomyces luteoverticillatus TaxID=66425 RepID=A0A3S9PPV5_STRLT|nr:iron-containing alcohol dehydrogenase [Streptomyces luteoverticillatus]
MVMDSQLPPPAPADPRDPQADSRDSQADPHDPHGPHDSPPPLTERHFSLGDRRVRVLLGHDCLDDVAQALTGLDADRFVFVTDDTVQGVVASKLAGVVEQTAPALLLSHPPGEAHKNLATLSRFIDLSLDFKVTRRSVVVAVGGGIPGNIAGLLAGLLFRGIRLVHVPTTVIAACDSVISAKQAVNTAHAKNTVGLYHPPELIVVDFGVVAMGSPRDMRSGTCETVKNALAIDPGQIPTLRRLLRPRADYTASDLEEIFELSLAVKSRLLLEDPHEKYSGVLLEYGHTVGHALELASAAPGSGAVPVKHGEAVALGMAVAADVAHRLGALGADAVATHEELIERVGVCRCLTAGLDTETVMHHIGFDNKRGYEAHTSSDVPMVLLGALGVPLGLGQHYLTPVPRRAVRAAVDELLRRGRECDGGHDRGHDAHG